MSVKRNPGQRWRRALLAVAAAAMLAACGGGTSQFVPFVPVRLVVLGDESSYLTKLADAGAEAGRKYGVNVRSAADADPPNALDCNAQPIWVQTVASTYGFAFAECDPTPGDTSDQNGKMYAAPGAKVADIDGQISAATTAGLFEAKVLVTIMAGANDVLAIYDNRGPTPVPATLQADATARGVALANKINALLNTGARVIVSTIPDLGVSPYARRTGADAALLTALSLAFNGGLQATILNDGRYIGLVQADEMVQQMNVSPGSFGLVNVLFPVCSATATLPDCDSNTLVTDGTSAAYLWADDTRMAYGGQFQLGLRARARALGNPFF
jgi:phospholipase/lecithinase/hemolysin